MNRIAAAVALSALALTAPSLHAQASSLTLTPSQPQEGQPIAVEYSSGSRFSGAETLVVRARCREPNTTTARHAVLGRVERNGGRTYRGVVQLPEGAVYCVLAVEDTAAMMVDAGGEFRDVRLHGADGRPLFASLDQQYNDLAMRNTRLARDVAAEMGRLYPDEPRAHFLQLIGEREGATAAERDGIRDAHLPRLRTLLARADSTDSEYLGNLVFYADNLGDTAAVAQVRRMMFTHHPASRGSKQQRVFMMSAKDGRPAYWAQLDSVWRADPTEQNQLVFTALRTAEAWKDAEQIRIWGERGVEHGALARGMVIPAYLSHESLKAEGLDHIRAYVRELEKTPDAERPLVMTRAEHRAMINRWTGGYLADLGQALADAGQHAAALDTLSMAVDAAWNPRLFRTVATARLAMGDTAGALPLFARIAADPLTAASFTDSIASQLGAAFPRSQWTGWVEDGRRRLTRDMLLYAVDRPAASSFTLTDADGTPRRTSSTHGSETFVAVFSRDCVPSLMQMKQLDGVMRQMQAAGVRTIGIAYEDPSPELKSYFAEQKLAFAYHYDVDREAARELGFQGTPTYMLMDAQGRVRFVTHTLENITRQLWVLRQESGSRLSRGDL